MSVTCFGTLVWVLNRYASCNILLLQDIFFLYQLNCMDIMRLSLSCGKSGHFQFLGLLTDMKHWCLSRVYVKAGVMIPFSDKVICLEIFQVI